MRLRISTKTNFTLVQYNFLLGVESFDFFFSAVETVFLIMLRRTESVAESVNFKVLN